MHNDWVGNRGHHESLGCVAMLHQPSGRNGSSPQRRKYTKKYDQIVPSSPQAPRPSGVIIVGLTTATATLTTSHNHCAQAGRNTIGTWLCTKPRHRDCVDMPDTDRHPHREAMDKQHTQPKQSRCVPFSDPHVHKVARSTDTRQECTNSSAKTMGTSPPSGGDTPCRRQVQREEKGGGASAKSSVLILTCVPLPHLVLPLSGWPAQAPRQWQHEVRQGDTHDSGSAAIRGVPLPNPHRKIDDGPVRVKASRLGGQSGSS